MSLPPPNLPRPQMPSTPPPPRPRSLLAKLASPKVWVPVLCVIAFVLVVLLAWWLSGSWLAALVTALAIALVVLVVVLLRVVFTQDREDRIERGIALERQPDQSLPQPGAPAGPGDVDASFRRGIAALQASKMGRDFYALPWLLVIGESGSGKSDALLHCGLDVPPEFAHLRPTGPTRDVSFWFTNQSILLDTAGRFVESQDAAVAEEWRRLLQLLRSNRPGTPLDGLIVAVPIDALIGRNPQELAERAHTLRRRVNELTDQLRLDVPIYVIVTKTDRLEGFGQMIRALPPDRLGQAFGWTNDRRHFADAGELVTAAFDEVTDQLEHLLPEMILREADPTRRRRLFLFPQEFREAVNAVALYLRAAFAPSVYGEVPFLRGVYFTSARSEGPTLSPVLQRLGQDWARSQQPAAAGQPAFLLDVFREVALGDRDLAMPATWMGRRFRRAAVIATAAVALLVMLLLGVSFVDNLLTIRALTNESRLVVDGASSLEALERLRSAIVATGPPGESIQRLPLGGMGLAGNLDYATARARSTFNWAFGREYESPAKARLVGKVRDPRASDSFEALATLAIDVTWLAKRAPEDGAARPDLKEYAPIGRNEADIAAFTAGYDSFVRWIDERELHARVESERDAVNAAAARLLDLRRLEQWAAETREPVRYSDFGIRAPEQASVDEVHPAYTRDVWSSLVEDLVAGVRTTGGVSSGRVEQFRQSYVQNFDRNWRDFLLGTPTEPTARGRRKDSPYLALVERIDEETRTELPRADGLPPWIEQLRDVRRKEPASEEEPLAPWQRYEVELEQVDVDVEAATEQGEQALELTRRLKDPAGTAFGSGLELVRELVRNNRDGQASRKLREVLSMPFLDGAADVLASAMQELDRRWRDNIAEPYAGELGPQQLQALFRPDGGDLARFVEEEGLDDFYTDGRVLPVIGGAGLPLGNGFLGWMEHAEKLQRSLYPGPGEVPRISVRLEGIPSRVVSGAGLFVTRRDLRLACRDDVETFVYREGSGSHTFEWSPHCQEVSLRIWARQGGSERELLPRKEWTGPLAFPRWLQQAQRLSGNTLRWRADYDAAEIIVDYRLRAGASILEIAHRPPPNSMRN